MKDILIISEIGNSYSEFDGTNEYKVCNVKLIAYNVDDNSRFGKYKHRDEIVAKAIPLFIHGLKVGDLVEADLEFYIGRKNGRRVQKVLLLGAEKVKRAV